MRCQLITPPIVNEISLHFDRQVSPVGVLPSVCRFLRERAKHRVLSTSNHVNGLRFQDILPKVHSHLFAKGFFLENWNRWDKNFKFFWSWSRPAIPIPTGDIFNCAIWELLAKFCACWTLFDLEFQETGLLTKNHQKRSKSQVLCTNNLLKLSSIN